MPVLVPTLLFAQGLEARIASTIDSMITIFNLILVGAVAWAGFLMARGEGGAVTRLIYSIVGLIVVNSARLIIDFFLF